MLVSILSVNNLYCLRRSFSYFFNTNKLSNQYYINFFLSILWKITYKKLIIVHSSFFFYKKIWLHGKELRANVLNKFNDNFLNDSRCFLTIVNYNNYLIYSSTVYFSKSYKNFVPKDFEHNYKFFIFSSNFLLVKSRLSFFAHFKLLLNLINFKFNFSPYTVFYTILSVNFKNLNIFHSLRVEKNLNLLYFNSYLV